MQPWCRCPQLGSRGNSNGYENHCSNSRAKSGAHATYNSKKGNLDCYLNPDCATGVDIHQVLGIKCPYDSGKKGANDHGQQADSAGFYTQSARRILVLFKSGKVVPKPRAFNDMEDKHNTQKKSKSYVQIGKLAAGSHVIKAGFNWQSYAFSATGQGPPVDGNNETHLPEGKGRQRKVVTPQPEADYS